MSIDVTEVEVLLVEDTASDAELTIRALKKRGLANRLVWVKDGAEALEFLFGTNPTSAASKPDVTVGIRRAVRVEFPTIVGVRYQLMSADAATGPWTNIGAPFSGTGASYFQYFDADPLREHRRPVLPPVCIIRLVIHPVGILPR